MQTWHTFCIRGWRKLRCARIERCGHPLLCLPASQITCFCRRFPEVLFVMAQIVSDSIEEQEPYLNSKRTVALIIGIIEPRPQDEYSVWRASFSGWVQPSDQGCAQAHIDSCCVLTFVGFQELAATSTSSWSCHVGIGCHHRSLISRDSSVPPECADVQALQASVHILSDYYSLFIWQGEQDLRVGWGRSSHQCSWQRLLQRQLSKQLGQASKQECQNLAMGARKERHPSRSLKPMSIELRRPDHFGKCLPDSDK